MKLLLGTCLPSFSLAWPCILLLRHSCAAVRIYTFGIPMQTEDQQLPRNPPGLQQQTRAAETSFLWTGQLLDSGPFHCETVIVGLLRLQSINHSNES